MSPAFAVHTTRLDDARGIVAPSGEIDIYTAPRLRGALVQVLEDGVRDLVVDLSAVEFIDSTALGVLIGGVRRVNDVGGRMAIVVATRPVARALSVTGLDRVFAVHESLDAALAELS